MATAETTHEALIRRCYALAASAVQKTNHPFGALIVRRGTVVCEAENTVNTDRDATGHAEMNALRAAARVLSREEMAECTLYTSTEPCVMCSGGIYWAGVGRVVYGCPEARLAEAAGADFLVPCREVLAKGSRKVEVEGPVLADEGFRLHADYW
jgi:tRNA(Arg) A34 adenosine deaminase TadA